MQWALSRVAEPAAEPVTIDEAKLHVRVDNNDEDALISRLIVAARAHVEDFQRRALVTQTWLLSMDRFPRGPTIRLPRPPLQSVSSVTYVDPDGIDQTLDGSKYTVDELSEPGRVVLNYGEAWPETALVPAAVRITYVAGYGDATAVPQAAKQAVLLLVGHWYLNREAVNIGGAVTSLPLAVESLLWPHRVAHFHPAGESG